MSEADASKSCPYCGETILAVAKKCRFCRKYLDDVLAAENAPTVHRRNSTPSAEERMLMPVGRPISAIAAGYLGLLAFIPMLGIGFGLLGVIFGTQALKAISEDPELSGKGRAWFGIVAGGILGMAWLAALALILFESSRRGSF